MKLNSCIVHDLACLLHTSVRSGLKLIADASPFQRHLLLVEPSNVPKYITDETVVDFSTQSVHIIHNGGDEVEIRNFVPQSALKRSKVDEGGRYKPQEIAIISTQS
jgi:hypothetical protein